MTEWVEVVGIFITVLIPMSVIVALGSAWHVMQQRRTVKRRLCKVSLGLETTSSVNTSSSKAEPNHMSKALSKSAPLFGWETTPSPLARIKDVLHDSAERIDALFGQQGRRAVIICILLVMGMTGYSSDFLPLLARVVLVVIVPMIGFAGMYWLLRSLQMKAFDHSFPQVIGQISRAVAAGVSVPQAIAQVPEYQQGVLGHEFGLLRDRLEIGISLKEALAQSSKRLPYSGFHFFTVALILNQENGGQLREVLHSLSRTLHDNSAIKMKIKSLTAEPRMTAIILASLPLILIGVMFVKTPTSFAVLTTSPTGHYVLMYVALSMGLGLAIINMLTKVRAR